MTPKSARKNPGAIAWLLGRNEHLGSLASVVSIILGALILSVAVWLGWHAQEIKGGLRGLLGLFLVGGWSLRMGLKGLSKKRRHRDDA
jgi:steroid 5-alpha reductase family enzyme